MVGTPLALDISPDSGEPFGIVLCSDEAITLLDRSWASISSGFTKKQDVFNIVFDDSIRKVGLA